MWHLNDLKSAQSLSQTLLCCLCVVHRFEGNSLGTFLKCVNVHTCIFLVICELLWVDNPQFALWWLCSSQSPSFIIDTGKLFAHHPWWLILSWTLLCLSLHTSHPPQLSYSFSLDLLRHTVLEFGQEQIFCISGYNLPYRAENITMI